VDQWSPDPWKSVNNAGTYSSANYPGEAQLLYPGQDVGVVGATASMRLKWLRDGVEDYDYYALLAKAGKGQWALQQIQPIAPDWKGWTRDATALASTRETLGDALDQLGPTGGDSGAPNEGGASSSSSSGDSSAPSGSSSSTSGSSAPSGSSSSAGGVSPPSGSSSSSGDTPNGDQPSATTSGSQGCGGCATSSGGALGGTSFAALTATMLALLQRRRRN
jgi:uncharacterized protein (TIGR03382 family)